jgi:succinate dehydrogenase flavin-adding protein (antitoxin of CptAB toxin-antitoxin module)
VKNEMKRNLLLPTVTYRTERGYEEQDYIVGNLQFKMKRNLLRPTATYRTERGYEEQDYIVGNLQFKNGSAFFGPEGSRRFRLLGFNDIRHVKVVRLSASRTGRLYLQEWSWYSFSLGAESTPGPWCGGKECH